MKKLTFLALALLVFAMPMLAQERLRPQNFASDLLTVPVMGNVAGVGGARFQTFVALLNPTASAFPVEVTLYDASGTPRTATINLAAGELKTYQNFLDEVFHFTGGGAVTFKAPESTGGTHNNRFILNAEIWTTGTRYGTSIPALVFPGSSSRSFAAGINVNSTTRTNIGCFNQSSAANAVRATVYDKSGQVVVGTVDLNLAAKAWGQAAVIPVVTDGYVVFDPAEDALCYAVVVTNATNDGHFITATEFEP